MRSIKSSKKVHIKQNMIEGGFIMNKKVISALLCAAMAASMATPVLAEGTAEGKTFAVVTRQPEIPTMRRRLLDSRRSLKQKAVP